MKNYLLCIPLFLFCFQCFSQKNYKITYRHNVQMDTMQILKDTLGAEAIMIGNANESNYSFYKAVNRTLPVLEKGEKTLQELINSKQSGTVTTRLGIRSDTIGNMVFLNKKSKTILVREKMLNEYAVTEENTPRIDWIILPETKLIKTYNCKKATTHFRGRDYIAWFTTDIPIVAGPWKFVGLPGLIMDIEDSRHQVKLYVEKIEFPTIEKVPAFVHNGNKTTLEKYFIFRNEEYKKRLEGMRIAQMQQEGMQEIIANGGVRPTVTSKSTIYGIEISMN